MLGSTQGCEGGRLRNRLLAAWFLMTAVAVVSAQEGKNEVSGLFGETFISDQGVLNSGLSDSIINHGSGFSFEINYARIILYGEWFDFAVEVPAVFNPDEDLHYFGNQIPDQYGSFFVTPAARLRLIPGLAFSPWISLGGGFGHFEASSNLLFGGKNTGDRGATSGVLQGGVGLDVNLPWRWKRVRLRVAARDDWSGVPPLNVDTGKSRQHNYFVGGGLVYRF